MLTEVRHVVVVDTKQGEMNAGVDIGRRQELQHGGVGGQKGTALRDPHHVTGSISTPMTQPRVIDAKFRCAINNSAREQEVSQQRAIHIHA